MGGGVNVWHIVGVKAVRFIVVCCAMGMTAGVVRADIDPLSGIDFVTITHTGNAPWTGDGTSGDQAIGRGRVDYEYRIGKYEITTAQYVEFMNAAFDRPQSEWIPHLFVPGAGHWGALEVAPTTPGGRRWMVPAGNEMRAVGNVDWRMAAVLCNWYHNNKSLDRSAFLTGAYDVSTFGYFGNIFTDQAQRSPGARYFIPTWDEHLKATHYDPGKVNPDGSTGGWWLYGNGTDQPFIAGPPASMGGTGTANFGWSNLTHPGLDAFTVPLGTYGVTSPFGLYDVAGATTEWTEEIIVDTLSGVRWRGSDGTRWNSLNNNALDRISYRGGEFPSISTFDFGIRVAAVVPAPGGTMILCLAVMLAPSRRRRCKGNA